MEETKNTEIDTSQNLSLPQIVNSIETSFFDDTMNAYPMWIKNFSEYDKIQRSNFSQVVLHEGSLFKQSQKQEKDSFWKMKFFILYEDRLCMFQNARDAKINKIKSTMLINSVRLDLRPVCEQDQVQIKEKQQYYLHFISCKQSYFLFASSQEAYEEWVRQLKQTCILTNYSQVYANLKILGQGTFAKVFLAKNRETGKEYAVKTFDKQTLLTAQNSERTKSGILNEINILRKCHHPNIIELFQAYESERFIYLVQNILKGGELFDTILKVGAFSDKDTCKIIYQLLSALKYLHSLGIMHRDLKPENLILRDNSEDFYIFLADFGLAAFMNSELLFQRCGTPGYVAPELLQDKDYDNKVDVFSAGVILYILLTGCSPFYGNSYNEILIKNKSCTISFDYKALGVTVSDEADDLLQKLLQVDPKKRLTATDALNHPWIIKNLPNVSSSDPDFDDLDDKVQEEEKNTSAFENMKQFQGGRFNVGTIKPKDIITQTPLMGKRQMNQISNSQKCESPTKFVRHPNLMAKEEIKQDNKSNYLDSLLKQKETTTNDEIRSKKEMIFNSIGGPKQTIKSPMSLIMPSSSSASSTTSTASTATNKDKQVATNVRNTLQNFGI